MVTFVVSDMTCGHCVKTITQAVQKVVPGAEVQIDLATHQVQVSPDSAAAQAEAAIHDAGYQPKKI
ncbi:heavy metal transporter [Bordetella genomosp. 1]|uniref:Heavy metal transporter n=1 Tax=Bordetella genomosp. 1 TaxID=1395607 RepID=A0A261SER9_9BORD|nr:heavy-metal-associated domain-containing protein [Bordetella genomosp. 1]OZI35866.1 heavy metal transporter [Bordetella genomosp. 1]